MAGARVNAQLTNVQQIEISDGTYIYPTTGNHLIIGTISTARFCLTVALANSEIAQDGNGELTISDTVAGRDGTNNVLDVDYLQFTDKMLVVANVDNANIARLYSAALNRAPDTGGLSGWEDIYAHNISAAAKAGGVYTGACSDRRRIRINHRRRIYTINRVSEQIWSANDSGFVGQLYQNVLGRTPIPQNSMLGSNLMHNGDANGTHFTRDMVLVGFAESPENTVRTAADWLIQV